MHKILTAAELRFGEVIKIEKKNPTATKSEYKLTIRRDNPVFHDRPFMTITGYIDHASGAVAFCWGHYDLTEEQILDKESV